MNGDHLVNTQFAGNYGWSNNLGTLVNFHICHEFYFVDFFEIENLRYKAILVLLLLSGYWAM